MANIVVVHDAGIEVYKSWNEVKKNTSFTKDDFTQVGVDYVVNLDKDSYEIAKDVKLLERVASERVFAKQAMSGMDYISIFTLLLVLYGLIS